MRQDPACFRAHSCSWNSHAEYVAAVVLGFPLGIGMVLLIRGPEFTIGHRIISRHLEATRRTGSARRVLAVERRIAKSRTAMHKEQARGASVPRRWAEMVFKDGLKSVKQVWGSWISKIA